MKRSPRPLARLLAAGAGVLALGACTPQAYIDQIFGEHAGEATRVAQCESGMNPGAVSPGGGNHGLFQINNVHRASFERVTGQPWPAVYSAYFNAEFARWLYDQQGWRPWSCRP
jgi:hypothetical protein